MFNSILNVKMCTKEIKTLSENVISQIRSTMIVNNINQCVTELALNSLDARSTSIAIRLNLQKFRIQIIDNGHGISRENLKSLGKRYMTSKCNSLSDLKKCLKFHGFRGEAIASIIATSQRVTIASRAKNCAETCTKIINGGETISEKIELSQLRPEFGTTVTVEGFLNLLPVRQKCIKANEIEIVRKSIQALGIIYPRVSFTLRNDANGELLLDLSKSNDILSAFCGIHPEISNNFSLVKVKKEKIIIEGLIHKELYENKQSQYIFVNKRPVQCPKVANYIANLVNGSKIAEKEAKNKHPVYILKIKCPYNDLDLNLEPNKTSVLFKKFDLVKKCVAKIFGAVFELKYEAKAKKIDKNKCKSEFGLSVIGGAIRGFGHKANNTENMDSIDLVENKENVSQYLELPEEEILITPKLGLPSDDSDFLPIKRAKIEEILPHDETMCTNFPENESKGKDLIMDMFIKSVQVYPRKISSESDHDSSTEIDKEPPYSVEKIDKSNQMVSIGVQTDFGPIIIPKREVLRRHYSDKKFESLREKPSFLNMKDTNFFSFQSPEKDNFRVIDKNNHILKMADDEKLCFENENDCTNELYQTCLENIGLSPIPKENLPFKTKNVHDFLVPKVIRRKTQYNEMDKAQESPYFMKNRLPYKLPSIQVHENICIKTTKDNKLLKKPFFIANKGMDRSDINFSGNTSQYFDLPDTVTQMNESEAGNHFSPDLFNFSEAVSIENGSNIIITINDTKQREELLRRDWNLASKKFKENFITPTFPESASWISQVDNFGKTIYKNTKTGVYSFSVPKKEQSFEILDRFDFIPKGQSPILKQIPKVDDMSPDSKQHFQTEMVKSYDDELLMIKWQNYIENKNPKEFFEEIYVEKRKMFEDEIPNVVRDRKAQKVARIFESKSFSKDIFDDLEVIGQVDCKFIAAFHRGKKLLLLFDQHAVNERVRLEDLMKSANSPITLPQNMIIFLPNEQLGFLKTGQDGLCSLGLRFEVIKRGISVFAVPLCIYYKFSNSSHFGQVIEGFVKEVIETLRCNNGIMVKMPMVMQDIVKMEACRYAIKFGDCLTIEECRFHLRQLSQCELPFQCAHGRPTLVPLITLYPNSVDIRTPMIDLKKLLKL